MPAVLIPRPETELLVEHALPLAEQGATTALDLCCGSGAIAISLATEATSLHVTGSDLSSEAIRVARALGLVLIRDGRDRTTKQCRPGPRWKPRGVSDSRNPSSMLVGKLLTYQLRMYGTTQSTIICDHNFVVK